MPLKKGTRLGHYEILALVGAGGMGEVYRARDTLLGRQVAIKVLLPGLAGDQQRQQRFEREARAISRLSHPHICTLYDLGRHDGMVFLVMEYLEGETLAARVSRGALPAKELLRYAAEVADALAEAHRGGVLHRDLKPSNVMLTKSGTKLLDFGLAKLPHLEGVPSAVSGGLAVTATEDLTLPGVVLGTLAYMAPEQSEGRETDARSDIFSFGVVVYEMATGRKPFADDTPAGVMAAILKRDPPPISTLRSEPEPFCRGLDWIILKCLAKDPAQRWQAASDLASALKWVAEVGPPEPTGRRKLSFIAWPPLVWTAALALIGALIVGIAQFRKPQPELGVLRFAITPPDKTFFGARSSFAISETGRLAFVATSEGKSLLWVRPLDSLTAQALPGTEDASYPFWSPDGHSIGFFAHRKLKTIRMAGGQPQIVCQAQEGRGGTWNRDGIILFAPSIGGPLYRVPAVGGQPTPVTQIDPSNQEDSHRWPHFLLDGRHFVYFVRSTVREHQGIYLGSLDSRVKKPLIRHGFNAMYAPPGYLLYTRDGELVAQPFDSRRMEISGEPVAISAVESDGASHAKFSVSPSVLLYLRSGSSRTQLDWYDRSGKRVASISEGNDAGGLLYRRTKSGSP